MTSIDVMAAFDFLDKEERIGTLSYERINGDASYLFEYNPDFLKCMPGTVPDTEAVLLPGQKYHVLLSKRFDRDGEKRIHYASSLTLTGLKDGDGAGTGKGYPDIANAIVSEMNVSDVNTNLEQLYRRIAFNIAIGNYDDHFRNHGFILTSNGWTLSPAFDLNPTNMTSQSLMISSSSNESSLGELLRESDAYLIERKSAEEIIKQVVETVSSWRQTAKAVGINVGEQQRFAKRLDLTKLLS